jgi:predicted ArsR family transcriptional regulator
MATKVQRLKAMLEAVKGNTVTNAEMDRAAAAFIAAYAPNLPADAPPEEKAGVVLQATRRYLRETVTGVEAEALRRQVVVTPPDYGND